MIKNASFLNDLIRWMTVTLRDRWLFLPGCCKAAVQTGVPRRDFSRPVQTHKWDNPLKHSSGFESDLRCHNFCCTLSIPSTVKALKRYQTWLGVNFKKLIGTKSFINWSHGINVLFFRTKSYQWYLLVFKISLISWRVCNIRIKRYYFLCTSLA